MTDNYKNNDSRYCHKLTVATLVFVIALGFGSLGGGDSIRAAGYSFGNC